MPQMVANQLRWIVHLGIVNGTDLDGGSPVSSRIALMTLVALSLSISACTSSDGDNESTVAETAPDAPSATEPDTSTTTKPDTSTTTKPDTSTTTKPDTSTTTKPDTSTTTKPDTSTTTKPDTSTTTKPDTSTTTKPDTSTTTKPIELPLQTFSIATSGAAVSGNSVEWNAVRTQSCPPPGCTVELFGWGEFYTHDFGSDAGTTPTPAGGCWSGNRTTLGGVTGDVCVVTLSAPASANFGETTVQVTFKATAAASYTWTAIPDVPNGTLVAKGDVITVEVDLTYAGPADMGGRVSAGGNNLNGSLGVLSQGPAALSLTVAECRDGESNATATFTIEGTQGGTTYIGLGSPARFSWPVAECP